MRQQFPDLIQTRRTLLARLKDWKDQDSWEEFFEIYWRVIYNFAVKSGLSDAEAQDVVQETVLTVARKMPQFEYHPEVGSFKSWLFHTAQWRIADQFRKRDPRGQSGSPRFDATPRTATIERVPDPAPPPNEAVWDKEWQDDLLEQATQRVKELVTARQFQMFDLYVRKRWPVAKVAEALSVTSGQVYLAKHRVSKLVKKEISRFEHGMFRPSKVIGTP